VKHQSWGSNIYGAVFIAGDDQETTKVSGNSEIHFSMKAIIEALGSFDSDLTNDSRFGSLAINSWKEINLSEY